jgi:hypothetical protein
MYPTNSAAVTAEIAYRLASRSADFHTATRSTKRHTARRFGLGRN